MPKDKGFLTLHIAVGGRVFYSVLKPEDVISEEKGERAGSSKCAKLSML